MVEIICVLLSAACVAWAAKVQYDCVRAARALDSTVRELIQLSTRSTDDLK